MIDTPKASTMASCEKGPDYEHQPDPPPYPPKEEQRAPMMRIRFDPKDPDYLGIRNHAFKLSGLGDSAEAAWFIKELRLELDELEAKIASGELMVVKTATLTYHHDDFGETGGKDPVFYHEGCSAGGCHEVRGGYDEETPVPYANFCPGCGARIVP